MANNGNGQGTSVASAASAGLTPQMSIVNLDRTPTVFFFRWLMNSRGANQTPWTSDIDAAGYTLKNLSGLTLTGPITFPDGTVQTTAFTGAQAAGAFGDTIKVNSVGISDDPDITVNAPPFFKVNGAAWPQ